MKEAPRYLQGGVAIPRPLLWGIAALSLSAGLIGFIQGRDAVQWTESEAINAYVGLYVQQTGGEPTDCTAVPGEGRVWLVVRCRSEGRDVVYPIARNGDLMTEGHGADT